MKPKIQSGNDLPIESEEYNPESYLEVLKKSLSKQKIHRKRVYDQSGSNSNESSMTTSLARRFEKEERENNLGIQEKKNYTEIPDFCEKYLPRESSPQLIYEEMQSILNFKDKEIESLRVYRDELKFISYNTPYESQIKISIRLLQEKAAIESKIRVEFQNLESNVKRMDQEISQMEEYSEYVMFNFGQIKEEIKILDIEEEKAIMIGNIKMEADHYMKEIEDEKRRNNREIRHIQDQIFGLRVEIKEKEDKIKELKTKICTLYIKMHSKNDYQTDKKDRNVSMSIRKHNKEKHHNLQETFIGNRQFKNYSQEIIEQINEEDELMKIRFVFSKEKLNFECVYKDKEKVFHSPNLEMFEGHNNNGNEEVKVEEIEVRYLMSIKFFFRSKLVGVECRVKTSKGNKHIQIGICEHSIGHELFTLVGKKLMTLSSYWHAKEMIGVSLWYTNKMNKKKEEFLQSQSKKSIDNHNEYFV